MAYRVAVSIFYLTFDDRLCHFASVTYVISEVIIVIGSDGVINEVISAIDCDDDLMT